MYKTIERRIDVESAIKYAEDIYISEDIQYFIERKNLTEKVYTTSVYLDKEGIYTTQGNGKGIGLQSLASAMFEGLEHYYSDIYDYIEHSQYKKLKDIIGQNEQLKIEAPLYEMCEKKPDQEINCMEFKSLDNKTSLLYPTFLVYPKVSDVDDEYLCYATNNGISTGIDLNEAILHAVCELVERNSISKAMINLLKRPIKKMSIVNKKTLPNNLINIIDDIETQYGEIKIYDITWIDEFPTYMTVFKGDISELPICGCGSSMDSYYALERAILECLQLLQIYSEEEVLEDLNILQFFSPSREITNMLTLNNIPCKISKYVERKIDVPDVDSILKRAEQILNKNRYQIYYRILNQKENFSCVKVIIPGFEKFHLIREGCPVCANKKLEP